MKYKLLISDFDGTLSGDSYTISEKNLRAIEKFTKSGGIFTISTGRMKDGILPIAKRYGIEGIISCYNGAEIFNTVSGEIYNKQYIKNEILVESLKLLESFGVYFQTYDDGGMYIEKPGKPTDVYEKMSMIKANVVGEKLSDYYYKNKKDSYKIFVMDECEILNEVHLSMQKALGDKLNVIHSIPENVEITDKSVSKAKSVEIMSEKLGISPNEIITVGDGGNDSPMLSGIGLGIAVNNATENCKKSANVVIPVSANDDAIAYIIEKYCL